MDGYRFMLLPRREVPMPIDWPAIEGGGIAMYGFDGQGTRYVWYLNEGLVAKAKRALSEAYEAAGEAERRALGILVKQYHGSWERLADLKACWYQQFWGSDETIVFHNFKEFLSLVVFESRAPL